MLRRLVPPLVLLVAVVASGTALRVPASAPAPNRAAGPGAPAAAGGGPDARPGDAAGRTAAVVAETSPGLPPRLDGATPFDLSLAASRATVPSGTADRAVIVLGVGAGEGLALAAVPLAAGGPVLLLGDGQPDPRLLVELERALAGGAEVFVVALDAGRAAAVVPHLGSWVPEVIVATTPAAASVAIARHVPASSAVLAPLEHRSGGALTALAAPAAGAAASTGRPVLLTAPDRLDPAVAAWLARGDVTTTWLVGDETILSDEVAADVPGPRRLAGRSPLGVVNAVVSAGWVQPQHGLVVVADDPAGWDAAVVAAALSGRTGAVVLPGASGEVVAAAGPMLRDCAADAPTITLVGSPAMVSYDVVGAVARTRRDAGCDVGSLAFAFMGLNEDGTPITQRACEPVRFVVNPAGAPAGAVDDLRWALDQAAAISGRRLVLEGTTTERAASPWSDRDYRSADGWKPVLVNWPTSWGGSTAWGYGGGARVQPQGRSVYVSGVVHLSPAIPSREALRVVLLHEIGHVLGLDHVMAPSQTMHAYIDPSLTAYQAGDRAGLEVVGAEGACDSSADGHSASHGDGPSAGREQDVVVEVRQ